LKEIIEAAKQIARKAAAFNQIKPEAIFILLLSAYIIASTFDVANFRTDIYKINNNANIDFSDKLDYTALVFIILFILYIFLWRIIDFHKYILFFSSFAFAVGLVANKNLNIAYNITVIAVLFYIISYCFQRSGEYNCGGVKIFKNGINFITLMALISILALAYTYVIGYACVLRLRSFGASTFDFGIFAQMFENMAKTGLPVTSVERNMHLSHFAVHFSPFYYLILPFYMINRSPETILVIQAAAVALGAFPLALIAKKFNLPHTNILLIILAYLFYPALTGGIFFDFHENKFLTVLIFWLLYFIVSEDKKVIRKYILIYIFTVLVLTVKEDAFLYTFCIALYMISIKKDGRHVKTDIIHGLIIAGVSVIYFIFAMRYLNTRGLGVMTWRFNLFMQTEESGLGAVIINIFKSPALLLASLISVPEKLEFLFYTLIPLCFLPFVYKRFNFVILTAPMIVINLATDYVYQYNINFQYTYGVTALLFFLALQNLTKIKARHIRKICVMMACFSIILFMSKNYNRFHSIHFIYSHDKERCAEVSEIIKQIPMDASVSAGTYMVPHLIQRENVYMVDIAAPNYFNYDTDYLVNDLRGVKREIYDDFLLEIENNGYVKIDSGAFVEIFVKEKNPRMAGNK